MKLSIADEDLEEIRNNIFYLMSMEKDLIYNISLAKDNSIVTVIDSYQKSKKQLSQVRTRLRTYENKKIKVKSNIAKYEKLSDEYYDAIDHAYYCLENNKKILVFKRRDNK